MSRKTDKVNRFDLRLYGKYNPVDSAQILQRPLGQSLMTYQEMLRKRKEGS